MRSLLELALPSDLERVGEAAKAVEDFCRERGIPPPALWKIRLSVVEALNNAIVHAYEGRRGNLVNVNARFVEGGLVISVSDRGRPLEPRLLEAAEMPPVPDPSDPDAIPERGRGLTLMRHFMDRVAYRSREGVNTMILEKDVEPLL